MNLQDIFDDAIEDLKDRIQDEFLSMPFEDVNKMYKEWNDDLPDWLHDIIFDVSDSNVPFYTSDLLDVASNDNWVATNDPSLGPAFDGSPTPTNIIAANIFEGIEERLWEFVNDEFIQILEDYVVDHEKTQKRITD